MELQWRFEHGPRRGSSDTFRGYFSDRQSGNNDVEVERTTTDYYYQRTQRHQRGIVLRTFRKGTSHFQITLSARNGRRKGSSGGHFNQAVIELKTRILLRKPQTEVLYCGTAYGCYLTSDSRLDCV